MKSKQQFSAFLTRAAVVGAIPDPDGLDGAGTQRGHTLGEVHLSSAPAAAWNVPWGELGL